SGVDTTHPDLNVLSGYDFISNDSDANPNKAQDDHQGVPHGTSCAGLAGAKTNNSLGVAAACWGCPIIPIRLIGGTYLYPTTIKDALQYGVDQGAWVVSNSWGPQGTDNYGNCISSPADNNQSAAVDYGRINGRGGKGTIFLWAAGNDGCNTSYQGFLKDDDMLTISALESNGSMASYSNFGSEIDVSAGAGNYTVDIQGTYGYNYSTGYDGDNLSDLNYTSVFSGTSAATPVAAGAVALMIAANTSMTFSGIMNCVKASAAKTSKTCSKGGWSTIQPTSTNWLQNAKDHCPCYGFGIVDANAMVNGAKNGTCGACISTADIDLCFGDGYDRDDDCDGTVDNECDTGGIGKAGDPCSKADDCLNTAATVKCITDSGWTGGYCSANCTKNSDCYNSNSGVECYEGACIAKCDYNEVRSGYECISDKILPEGTEVVASCGNDLTEGDEVCDGNLRPCTMIDDSFTGGYANCRDDCRGYDTSTCEGGGGDLCGNSNVDTGEICDSETIACSKLASTPPVGTAKCLKDCSGWDKSGCTEESGDSGDSGNSGDSGDSGDSGNSGNSGNTIAENVCGNGELEYGEQCDDGNTEPFDGCDPNCRLEGVKKKTSGGCSAVLF
ncbi:MAG TPA: S8 family serine peptidase, partial [bacterium]|nr:S8 family serine peptidase [bacterium]